jgi:hypothetical protein
MSYSDTGFRRLVEALTSLDIAFLVGGSMASSIHGVPRATMDIDLLVDLTPEKAAQLAEALASEFYVDAEAVEDALLTGRSFNLIHLASGYKFDLFPLTAEAFLKSEFRRRLFVEADIPGAGVLELPVATAEDTILAKLRWFRSGGEASYRQWDDVLGILCNRGAALDEDYLRRWARHLQLEDLLDRAVSEAPLRRPPL